MKPTLSIIIPAYNEALRIRETLVAIGAYLKERDVPYEMIVVDDGSTDGTEQVVLLCAKHIPQLRLLKNPGNKGKGYAVQHGMCAAQGAHRLFLDADHSVKIQTLDSFLPWLAEGFDVIIGSIKVGGKSAVEHNGWHRRLLGTAANYLIQALAVPGISDTQRGFKLFSGYAAERIFPLQTIDGFGFDIEILAIARKQGFAIKELPVEWDNPAGSKVGLFAYVTTMLELVSISLNMLLGRYSGKKRSTRTINA